MTDILEPILFKHYKPIKEKTDTIIKQYVYLRTEQFLKTCFTIPKELENQYTFLGYQIKNMPYKPEISQWIKCTYQLRRVSEDGIEIYCLNPFHPFASQYGIWLPICLKKDCDLDKICDDDPFKY